MEIQKAQAELQELIRLTGIERAEEIRQFELNVASRTITEKRDSGVTWHPVQVTEQGFGMGGDAYIIVERTRDLDKPHQLKSGNLVSVSTWQQGAKKEEEKGAVDYIHKNRMKVILYRKDLPDWLSTGGIAVELLADERTFREMETAIREVMKADQHTRLSHLRNILLGYEKAAIDPEIEFHSGSLLGLNETQISAVRQITTTADVAVIHGPPGTGKTTTLVHAIRYLTEQQRSLRILVCAPSNAAADLLTERIAAHGLHVTRTGNLSRIDEELVKHSLQGQLSTHPESKHIKRVRTEADQARREATRFRRSFGQDERKERRLLMQEAKSLAAWAKDIEDKLIEQILDNSQVIVCTLVGAASNFIRDRIFDYVVIDEAAQALEGATWIPVRYARKVVLVGDPLQLPPTVKSMEAARQGLSITLLEKYMLRHTDAQLLDVQYRMHEVIMGFSNDYFYNGQLKAAPGVAQMTLPIGGQEPLTFIDTTGCGFSEEQLENNLSKFNSGEFFILREYLYQLIYAYAPAQLPPTGIISPYKEQVEYIRKAIAEDALLTTVEDLRVNTIDGFQGQENDIICISLVRCNEKSEIGFLSDYRRMNVALTRARQKLIVIGDSGTLCNDRFYAEFITYCELHGAYHSAWEWMS